MIDNTQSKKCVHCGEEATVWSPTCQVHVMGTDIHTRHDAGKRCDSCNMPDVDGTLWVADGGLLCGSCLRRERDRLRRDLDQELSAHRQTIAERDVERQRASAAEKAMGEALRQAALDLGNVAAMAMLGEQIPAALVSNMEKQARCALAPPVLPPPHPTDCATPEMEAERAAVFDAAVRMMRTKPAEAQPHIVVDPERRVFAMEPPPSPVMPQAKGTCDRCKGTGWYKVPGGIEARCLHSISPSGDSSSNHTEKKP